MKLIALCGAAGAGKDTVADLLPYPKLAFADLLYQEIATAYAVDVLCLKDRARKEQPSGELTAMCCGDDDFTDYLADVGVLQSDVDLHKAFSPRQTLRLWADYRKSQDPDYFVKAIMSKLIWGKSYVITDVRHGNEARMVRSFNGEIWQVVRPGVTAGSSGHHSDVDGSQFEPDRIIVNDGDLSSLKAKVQ